MALCEALQEQNFFNNGYTKVSLLLPYENFAKYEAKVSFFCTKKQIKKEATFFFDIVSNCSVARLKLPCTLKYYKKRHFGSKITKTLQKYDLDN